MKRKTFIKAIGGLTAMTTLGGFKQVTDTLLKDNQLMPVLFMGHGSPMNGIEDNEFSRYWSKLAKEIPQPEAILCVSAHWLTKGTHVTAMDFPKTIHDFGGFPRKLFEVEYPAPGHPGIATETAKLIQTTDVGLDHDWGLDHGTWTVVRHMYPQANIPVFQLSIDYHKPAEYHYNLAKELAALRKRRVLIIGSGNMVHNLRMIDWKNMNTDNYGYDWARDLNEIFKSKISSRDHHALLRYNELSSAAKLAIPSPDHYYPLIYTLGLQNEREDVEFFNDKCVAGSLTMTSVRIGQ